MYRNDCPKCGEPMNRWENDKVICYNCPNCGYEEEERK